MATTHIGAAITQALTSKPGPVDLAESNQTEKLSGKEQAIVRATQTSPQNPRIVHMGQAQLGQLATRTRQAISLRLGQHAKVEATEEQVLRYMVQTFQKFPSLTLNEIIYAIDRALDGDYLKEGQTFVYFSISNLALWLKAYIGETKSPAMQKLARLQQDEKTEASTPSEAEQKTLAIKVVNQYLDARKADKEHRVMYRVSPLYDDLARFGIYEASEEEKREVIQEIRKWRPNIEREVLIREAKGKIYNSFIDSLLLFQTRLGADGKPIHDESPA